MKTTETTILVKDWTKESEMNNRERDKAIWEDYQRLLESLDNETYRWGETHRTGRPSGRYPVDESTLDKVWTTEREYWTRFYEEQHDWFHSGREWDCPLCAKERMDGLVESEEDIQRRLLDLYGPPATWDAPMPAWVEEEEEDLEKELLGGDTLAGLQ